ncbi:MAG: GGDEF domain-containing protein [Pirellulales bacterium]|nr:GGDEF domain-containing protein [Pirellulales bacterium]
MEQLPQQSRQSYDFWRSLATLNTRGPATLVPAIALWLGGAMLLSAWPDAWWLWLGLLVWAWVFGRTATVGEMLCWGVGISLAAWVGTAWRLQLAANANGTAALPWELLATRALPQASVVFLAQYASQLLVQSRDAQLFDPLTRLGNREAIQGCGQIWWENLRATQRGCAVIYLDGDNFRRFNREYGYEFGDLVLMVVGDYLRVLFPTAYLIGRRGGDEFVVLLPVASREELEQQLQHVIPLEISSLTDHECEVSLSLGVQYFSAPDCAWGEALNRAEQALLRAKMSEKAGICWESGTLPTAPGPVSLADDSLG